MATTRHDAPADIARKHFTAAPYWTNGTNLFEYVGYDPEGPALVFTDCATDELVRASTDACDHLQPVHPKP
jgi:hypothetical protein